MRDEGKTRGVFLLFIPHPSSLILSGGVPAAGRGGGDGGGPLSLSRGLASSPFSSTGTSLACGFERRRPPGRPRHVRAGWRSFFVAATMELGLRRSGRQRVM